MTIHEIKKGGAEGTNVQTISVTPLTDIAARLRKLADRIESGALKPDLALVILRFSAHDLPAALSTYAYGEFKSSYECDGIMLAAATGKNIVEMESANF